MKLFENIKNKKNSKKFWIILAFGLALIIGVSFWLIVFKQKSQNFVQIYSKNVNEYNLDVNIDCDNKSLLVKQKTTYINTTEDVSLKSIYFHIYPKAFCEGVINKPVSSLNEQKAYPNGINYGEFQLLDIKDKNGNKFIPRYLNADKDILVVDLDSELYPSKSVELNFEYNLNLPNINHRYGYGEDTINLGNFFLIACVYDEGEGFFANSYHYNGDPFYSDISNFDAKVTYNKNYFLATTGNVLSE